MRYILSVLVFLCIPVVGFAFNINIPLNKENVKKTAVSESLKGKSETKGKIGTNIDEDKFYIQFEAMGIMTCAQEVFDAYAFNNNPGQAQIQTGLCGKYFVVNTSELCQTLEKTKKSNFDCQKVEGIVQRVSQQKYAYYPETLSIKYEGLSKAVDNTLKQAYARTPQMKYHNGIVKLEKSAVNDYNYAMLRAQSNEVLSFVSMAMIEIVTKTPIMGKYYVGVIAPEDLGSNYPAGIKKIMSLSPDNVNIKVEFEKNQQALCKAVVAEPKKYKIIEKQCSGGVNNYIVFTNPQIK